MALGDAPEKSLRQETVRLEEELEQARVALEDAHNEIASLAAECKALRRRAESEELARVVAERAVQRSRQQAVSATEIASAIGRMNVAAENVDLRNALEESAVLAEELREVNDSLRAANEQLEQRVAQRTADLEIANQRLTELNKALRERVERAVEQRSRAQADLLSMQKLEAIGQLSGGIAHDFNNLLGVVISGLELLRKLPPDQHERVLRRTEEAAWRGSHLTRGLLAFARRQSLQPDRVDLLRHIENLRDLFAHSLRENIKVSTAVAPEVWPAEADPAALELALLNLAVNARDAMPRGGTVTLTACNRTIHDGTHGLADGDYVELAVVDNGPGMPPEVRLRVFEPFFSTKGDKGTGLGLAQVYGFAKQSGGIAWVDSEPGRGPAVRLLLPRSRRAAARLSEPAPVRAPARRTSGLNILVVEDDPDLAASVLDMLTQLGHSGTRVITMAAALSVLASGATVDLVFSDVLLPGGASGLDLAREIARRNLAVPLILTSGYGDGVTSRLAAANIPFLRKPYRIETLRQAIDSALTEIAEADAGG